LSQSGVTARQYAAIQLGEKTARAHNIDTGQQLGSTFPEGSDDSNRW